MEVTSNDKLFLFSKRGLTGFFWEFNYRISSYYNGFPQKNKIYARAYLSINSGMSVAMNAFTVGIQQNPCAAGLLATLSLWIQEFLLHFFSRSVDSISYTYDSNTSLHLFHLRMDLIFIYTIFMLYLNLATLSRVCSSGTFWTNFE